MNDWNQKKAARNLVLCVCVADETIPVGKTRYSDDNNDDGEEDANGH